MTASALERVIRRTASNADAEAHGRCDLCRAALGAAHRHMLEDERLVCVCRACSVLFQRDEAAEGRYRLVPEWREQIAGVSPAALGVPVGLAFFVVQRDGAVHAHYPSPAGATRWDVDGSAWDEAIAGCPRLAALEPEVQALLVNTARGRSEGWIVPIDDCYRLVGVVRRHWSGLYGGDRVWAEIDKFFEELRRRHGPDSSR